MALYELEPIRLRWRGRREMKGRKRNRTASLTVVVGGRSTITTAHKVSVTLLVLIMMEET